MNRSLQVFLAKNRFHVQKRESSNGKESNPHTFKGAPTTLNEDEEHNG
jgi:hypothetical protein